MSVKSVTVGARAMDWLAGGDDRRPKLKGILQIIYTYIVYIASILLQRSGRLCIGTGGPWAANRCQNGNRKKSIRFCIHADGRTDGQAARKRARRGGLTTIRHTATGDRKRCSLYIILCGSRPASGPRVRAYLSNIVRTRSAKTRTRDRLSISSCTYRKLPPYERPRSAAAIDIPTYIYLRLRYGPRRNEDCIILLWYYSSYNIQAY